MKRRTFFAASAAALAMPAVGRAQSALVFKWIPQVDLSVLDPVWTTAYPTRTHGYLVFDTLYGQTGPRGGYTATPQMVAGHNVEDDGRTWKLTLREGLVFHDGAKVLAKDCVASITALGCAGHDRPNADGPHRQPLRTRRQNNRLPAQKALPVAARRAGQGRPKYLRHHAGAHRHHRSVQAGDGGGRQRALQIQGRRTGAGRVFSPTNASPATSPAPTAPWNGPRVRKSRISTGSSGTSSPTRGRLRRPCD